MKLSAEGVTLVKSRESCRLAAYLCPGGAWTIGYGHAGPEVHEGLRISAAEAKSLLTADLVIFDVAVSRLCPNASAEQHAAMVSLCFNIGIAAFARSSVARLHNAGRHAQAAQAFALWNKAAGRVLPGLVTRRAAEAALYLSGESIDGDDSSIATGEHALGASRTLAGTAIGGTAAAAMSAGEVIGVLKEWREDLSGLIPYFGEIRWLLLVMTLAGLAIATFARWWDRREGRS